MNNPWSTDNRWPWYTPEDYAELEELNDRLRKELAEETARVERLRQAVRVAYELDMYATNESDQDIEDDERYGLQPGDITPKEPTT